MTEHLLIAGGTVIDGTGSPPVPGQSVLVTGDRIVAMGPEADGQAGGLPGVQRLDAAGCTVMPGLIDAHVHLTLGEPASNDELFHHRDQGYTAMLAAFNAQKVLRAGVTSALDADCLWNLGPALRDAVDTGVATGPRLAVGANALVTAVGGTAGKMIPDEGTAGYAQVVRSHDEIVQVVRRQVKHGADWIKIHATGLIPGRRQERLVWTPDELSLVCATAHDLDTPVVAHCRSADSTAAAARAGVDLIYHASFMDDAGVEAVVESGAVLCPTWTFLANLCDFGSKVGAAAPMVDIFRNEIEQTAAKMREAWDAGVTFVCGSESGFSLTPYGHWHARELELYVRYLGVTPLEAIRCATANGAWALRRPDDIGVLEPGRLADLLVVDGDPSQDVSLLGDRRRLRHIYKAGVPVDTTAPWPEHRPAPGEKVGTWSTQLLTWDVVNP